MFIFCSFTWKGQANSSEQATQEMVLPAYGREELAAAFGCLLWKQERLNSKMITSYF